MVVNTEIQDLLFDTISTNANTIQAGNLTGTPTSSTTALTNSRITKSGSDVTVTVTGNIIKFNTQLDETDANSYTINTMLIDSSGYILDTSKHTDIAKDNDVIIQYSDQILFLIE